MRLATPADLVVDLFAGGGGASTGLEAALGRPVDIAVNHSPVALAVHEANHPKTVHLVTSVWEVSPRKAVGRRRVFALWASPDCTHFSVAKGGKPREQGIRSLAWVVVDWAREVRPRFIFLENVAEFRTWGPLNSEGKPDKSRMGETFEQWRGALELLGYTVDYRVLDASHYGAPTKRRRLFLVARCDGQPVRWPAPTHGPGLLPVRTAAQCIDWSLPCPSIFERKRPLAEKTLWRIAQGIRRFVLESSSPFIVKVNHGVDSRTGSRIHGLDEPLTTITASSRGHALVAPTLIQTGYGERPGQRPRYLDLHQPLGTIMAGGNGGVGKHALVAAFLAKHYGGHTTPGSSLARPMDTITAQDHHALVTATVAGAHVAEVRAFLTAFYSQDTGQALNEPMRTITAKHRLGLVTVEGAEYQIADIGMRMLEPHELLRAQFGRYAESYDLSAAKTKAAQVRLIGNSVPPEVAEAVVAVNVGGEELREAA